MVLFKFERRTHHFLPSLHILPPLLPPPPPPPPFFPFFSRSTGPGHRPRNQGRHGPRAAPGDRRRDRDAGPRRARRSLRCLLQAGTEKVLIYSFRLAFFCCSFAVSHVLQRSRSYRKGGAKRCFEEERVESWWKKKEKRHLPSPASELSPPPPPPPHPTPPPPTHTSLSLSLSLSREPASPSGAPS